MLPGSSPKGKEEHLRNLRTEATDTENRRPWRKFAAVLMVQQNMKLCQCALQVHKLACSRSIAEKTMLFVYQWAAIKAHQIWKAFTSTKNRRETLLHV